MILLVREGIALIRLVIISRELGWLFWGKLEIDERK